MVNRFSTGREQWHIPAIAVDWDCTGSYDRGMEPTAPLNPKDDKIEYLDPVIEAYKKDIDRTMLRENLKKTVQERVDAFIDFMKAREECQRAGEAARERP